MMDKIEVDATLFEMILNSLKNQKFVHRMCEEAREEAQRVIDETWNKGMGILREYQNRKQLDDMKADMSEPARRTVEAREEFQEEGPRVVADMDWTPERRKEIMVILGGLSAALSQSKEIADPGYREWGHGGILNKCVQLIELKVSGWDKGEGSYCLSGYIADEIDNMGKLSGESEYGRGMLHAFNMMACKCSEICGKEDC
jgi:hypothetical protein